jgi:hypothetical protein
VIGILGGTSSIIGLLLIVLGALFFPAKSSGMGEPYYEDSVWLNAAIHLFTLYGTSASLYVFAQAAMITTTNYFYASLVGILLLGYAQVLLYCTMDSLQVLAIPRAFIPSLAVSVNFIVAISINDNHYLCADNTNCSGMQKALAWVSPALSLLAIVLMVGLRAWFVDLETKKADMAKQPFLRSLIITPFMSSTILSIYVFSLTATASDEVAHMFATMGLLLNFAIITVVFMPGAAMAHSSDVKV